ncbi:MAG: hypothetical protein R3E68_02420 [Burkholderiaceae bacterium]
MCQRDWALRMVRITPWSGVDAQSAIAIGGERVGVRISLVRIADGHLAHLTIRQPVADALLRLTAVGISAFASPRRILNGALADQPCASVFVTVSV